jgi:hypothetical protein
LIAAGKDLSLLHAIMASAPLFDNCRQALAYMLKQYFCIRLLLLLEQKPCHLLGRQLLGSVDYWLCQLFTRSLGTTLPSFRVLRVTRRAFSPPEGYM